MKMYVKRSSLEVWKIIFFFHTADQKISFQTFPH